jgi:hypothetical protein
MPDEPRTPKPTAERSEASDQPALPPRRPRAKQTPWLAISLILHLVVLGGLSLFWTGRVYIQQQQDRAAERSTTSDRIETISEQLDRITRQQLAEDLLELEELLEQHEELEKQAKDVFDEYQEQRAERAPEDLLALMEAMRGEMDAVRTDLQAQAAEVGEDRGTESRLEVGISARQTSIRQSFDEVHRLLAMGEQPDEVLAAVDEALRQQAAAGEARTPVQEALAAWAQASGDRRQMGSGLRRARDEARRAEERHQRAQRELEQTQAEIERFEQQIRELREQSSSRLPGPEAASQFALKAASITGATKQDDDAAERRRQQRIREIEIQLRDRQRRLQNRREQLETRQRELEQRQEALEQRQARAAQYDAAIEAARQQLAEGRTAASEAQQTAVVEQDEAIELLRRVIEELEQQELADAQADEAAESAAQAQASAEAAQAAAEQAQANAQQAQPEDTDAAEAQQAEAEAPDADDAQADAEPAQAEDAEQAEALAEAEQAEAQANAEQAEAAAEQAQEAADAAQSAAESADQAADAADVQQATEAAEQAAEAAAQAQQAAQAAAQAAGLLPESTDALADAAEAADGSDAADTAAADASDAAQAAETVSADASDAASSEAAAAAARAQAAVALASNASIEELYARADAVEAQITEAYRQRQARQRAMLTDMELDQSLELTEDVKPQRPNLDADALADAARTTSQLQAQQEAMGEATQATQSMIALAQMLLDQEEQQQEEQTSASASAVVSSASTGSGSGGGAPEEPDEPDIFEQQELAEAAAELASVDESGQVVTIEQFVERMGLPEGAAPMEQYPTPPTLDQDQVMPPVVHVGSITPGELTAGWTIIDSWYIVGPFPNPDRNNMERWFPPEAMVGLDRIDLDATYLGRDGQPVRWYFQQTDHRHGQINPLNESPYGVWYATAELIVDRPRWAYAAFASDDYGQVWVNDQIVWQSAYPHKSWRLGEAIRPVFLRAGRNRILYRIENGWREMAFSMAIHLTHDTPN